VAYKLGQIGHAVAALHGGMPQGRRNRVLQGLRSRQLRVLVATDVAARGIDVPTISHVINYGLPMKAEDYVHRIGRTGRAGRAGLAVTLAEVRDAGMIRRIQHFTTQRIPPAVIAGLEPKRAVPNAGMTPAGGHGHGFGHRGHGHRGQTAPAGGFRGAAGPRGGRAQDHDARPAPGHRGSSEARRGGHGEQARGPMADARGAAPRRGAGGARDMAGRQPHRRQRG
jgi:superfamily II DNA/RNA helicase